jgi:spermidine synthase
MFKYHGRLIFQGHDAFTSVEVVQAGGLYTLHFGSPVAQSSMYLEDPFKVEMEYNQVMLLSLIYNYQPTKVLCLGLGGGAKQKFLWKHFSCQVVTVEISPLVIDVGYRFFEIPHDDRMKIIQQDALEFLQRPHQVLYDFIFLDLYDAEGMCAIIGESPLFQLCRNILTSEGILVWNLWRSTKQYVMENCIFRLINALGQNYKILTVNESLNFIIYAFADQAYNGDYNLLQQRAEALSQKTGLDFLGLLSKQSSLHL